MSEAKAHASRSQPEPARTRSFFGGGVERAPFFQAPIPTLQRKCVGCDAEDDKLVQRKAADDDTEVEFDDDADRADRKQLDDESSGDGIAPDDSPSEGAAGDSIPPPPTDDDEIPEARDEVQPRLQIGASDDPLEVEADAIADRVVRRRSAEPVGEARNPGGLLTKLKIRRAATDPAPDSNLSGDIQSARGGGAPLASPVRDEMEEAFDVDFSDVRVHTGDRSAALNEEIGARAFTLGTDIHFNRGEFTPGTERGTHLLAHELTHVIQQNAALRTKRKSRRTGGEAVSQLDGGPRPFIQRKITVFGPARGRMPRGTTIHGDVLPLFIAGARNSGLMIEAPIPHANKGGVIQGVSGRSDFYIDRKHHKAVGINVHHSGRLVGLSVRKWSSRSAPKPPASVGKSVRQLDEAPSDIGLADLKPGNSAEEYLGQDQIDHYRGGITKTAEAVNDYQKAHGFEERWEPTFAVIKENELQIPEKLERPQRGGIRDLSLAIWEWRGHWKKLHGIAGMRGSLVVYKSPVRGIWAYEWLPYATPENIGSADVEKLLRRIRTEIKPILDGPTKKTPKLKAESRGSGPIRTRHADRSSVLRRQPKKRTRFDRVAWNDRYGKWKADAKKLLGISSGKKYYTAFETLKNAEKRTKKNLPIPSAVAKRGKEYAEVLHWYRFGRYYAWFRKTFDRVYGKLIRFGQTVKGKVKRLSRSVGGSRFGSWLVAAAKAIFRVFKVLGSWAITKIADALLDSLQQGISDAIKKLVDSATPDAVQSKIEEVRALKKKFEDVLAESQQNLEKRLFGNKLEMFSKLDEFMKIAKAVGTIVGVVRWGIRIIACASPPVVGCLWNLAIAALEFAFSKIMETQWFQCKVFGWIKDFNIRSVLNFPTDVASLLVTKANETIPLPAGIGPIFKPIRIDSNQFDMQCPKGGAGSPSPEQQALMKLAERAGEKRFEAFLELMSKRGAGHNVQLTLDRIDKKIAPLIMSLDVKQIREAAAGRQKGSNATLESFLKEIATHTPSERKAISERRIDYEKAQRSNPKFEKKSVKWKPETFVKPGIRSDTKEFADAIYDIQKMLGVKPDGMAGPATTKMYYEKNKQPRDRAYANAVAQLKRARLSREEKTKLDRVLAIPYPAREQLSEDLRRVSFPSVNDDAKVTAADGRKIIVARTQNGARIGAYFKQIEITRGDKTGPVLVDVSKFLALDPVAEGDFITGVINRAEKKEIEFVFHSFHRPVGANRLVEVTNVWFYFWLN